MAKLQKHFVNFTQVSNIILNDKNLSFKAKGVYAYLFSKPDDWHFSADRIKNDSTDGRDSIQSALKELEKFGYLSRKKQGDGSIIYFLDINPKTENPTLDTDPKPENPKVGKSQSRKIRLINNIDNNTNTELYTNTKLRGQISEKTKEKIQEFISYRKEKRSKLTERSILAIIKKAEQYGEAHTIATINRTIENGWQGLFWEKEQKSYGNFHTKIARNALTESQDYSHNRFATG